ncbi:hypothetical protein ADL29_22160 [Streptomyces chattanoogensis]|uniref:Uncharacterized protein n=1 Tax=Streptomyces chattanoogensis TaxID=66876 RepID=A0A0N0XTR2_9ACTN|nr:hypothetical protein ADL29_22160 [Streptomyces chattanoogensis]
MAAAWPWGPDPIRTLLFFLLAPTLLLAGALGAMGWSWWQRLLAGMSGLALIAYVVLVFLGLRRLRGKGNARSLSPEIDDK